MCHTHLTAHKPCQHCHLRATLCHSSHLPLITKHLATNPYLSPRDMQEFLIAAYNEHRVTFTTAQSLEPCCDCQLPDLDIWHLDGAVKIIGDVAKLERRNRMKIHVELEDGNRTDSTPPAVPELKMRPFALEKSNAGTGAMALPYVGGLGLLVMPKNYCVRRLKAKL